LLLATSMKYRKEQAHVRERAVIPTKQVAYADADNMPLLEFFHEAGFELPHADGILGLQRLHFPQKGLTGTLPSEIGKLINLQALDLKNNKLGGELPLSVIEMKSRGVAISLSWNNPGFSLPSNMGELRGLTQLDLSYCSLTGEISQEISLLVSLEKLLLNINRLEGPIPPGICQLVRLETLKLNCNKLSGRIPDIRKLTKLKVLSLEKNHLEVSNDEIDELTNLLHVDCAVDVSNQETQCCIC
jgi:hypothetical protein